MGKNYLVKKIPLFNDHERLLLKVKIINDCWIFNGALTKHGYGRFVIDGVVYSAHRVSYSIFNGELFDNLVIDHICRNKNCINPEHLRQVTFSENVLENSESIQAKNKKKTQCINGHYFSPENTRVMPNERRCRACERIREKKYRNFKKENK